MTDRLYRWLPLAATLTAAAAALTLAALLWRWAGNTRDLTSLTRDGDEQ